MKLIKAYQPPADANIRLANCDPDELAAAHKSWQVMYNQQNHDFLAEFPNPTAFAAKVLLEESK